jgi:hypothetical protein
MPNLPTLLSLLAALSGAMHPAPQPSSVAQADEVQIRINGPVNIAAGDSVSTVWVVNGDATVNGDVREGLVVINGTAYVAGRVEGGVLVVNGRLELRPGARVDRDIMLYRSTLSRANGAIIGGAVHEQTAFSIGVGAIWLIWLSFTIVVVLAGLTFALLAPTSLAESARQLTTHSGQSALLALAMAAGVPTLATLSFATVIGIPLGLMLLFVVIPALTFLGFLVSGAAIGSALMSRFSSAQASTHHVGSVVIGLIVLQCAVALPVFGGLIGIVASLLGVGALVSRSWTQRCRLAPIAAAPVPHAKLV